MIKAERCRGCGELILVDSMAGLTLRADSVPLEADAATQALLAGRELYRVTSPSTHGLQAAGSLGMATPAVLAALRTEPGERPTVVQQHRCTATGAPRRPSPVPSAQPTPPRPPAGRTTRFSGPSAAPSSVRSAEPRRSDTPRCDDCGLIMNEGDYVSVQLGEIYIWAQHIANCGG